MQEGEEKALIERPWKGQISIPTQASACYSRSSQTASTWAYILSTPWASGVAGKAEQRNFTQVTCFGKSIGGEHLK